MRDVLAHLVGVIEDAAAGRIQGPPGPDQTADEVDRHRTDAPEDLLDTWALMAPMFETAITKGRRWPAFLDVLSHEHDISGALGRYGPQDAADVELAARLLSGRLTDHAAITLELGDRTIQPTGGSGPELRLRTSPFELFRLRLGRRTRDQVLALSWSADPSPILDDLFVFGPAAAPFPD